MIQRLRGEKGFTLIELMIVIAIIGILAAIAIPNFIAYRDKAYCSYSEQDASNILSAISCYFSEPGNTTLTDFGTLQADTTCKVTVNGANIPTVTPDTTVVPATFTITVTDATSRCPRSSGGTLVYTTYMGTSAVPGWKTP